MAQGFASKTPAVKNLSGNSSTSAINTGSSFAGTWENVSGYKHTSIAVKTDQNGYFTIQYSPDGTNADSTLTRYYNTADIEAPHVFVNARDYVKVTFYNDSGSNQTYFRLQTRAGDFDQLNAPLDSTLARDYDAIVVRPTDFTTEVALSRRQGLSIWNKFGYNEAISNAAAEVVAEWGGTFQYLTAGETISIVSASTADDLVGTGLQQVVVYGIDANWDEQTVVYDMDGTTPVVSAESWIGINRIAPYKCGTGLKNAGKVTVTASSSGYTMATMPTGFGSRGGSVSQQLIFYVPRNYQALATWLRFNTVKLSGGGGNPEVTLIGYVYSDVATAEIEVFREVIDTANSNYIDLRPPEPFVIGEKSILWFEAITDNASTSAVRGRCSLKLSKDVDA